MKANSYLPEITLGAELIFLQTLTTYNFEKARSTDVSADVQRLALAEVRATVGSAVHPEYAKTALALHNLRLLLQALEAIIEPAQFEQWKETVKPVIEHIEAQQ